MITISAASNQYRMELGRRISDVLEKALACEPAGGTSSDWLCMLHGLGVEPISQTERFDTAQKAGQTKGAPVAEVEWCLNAIVEQVHEKAPSVGEELKPFLDKLVLRHTEQYLTLASLAPKPKSDPVGGMFAFAIATAEKKSQEQEYQGSTYVLRCPNCGGPRTNESDLSCEYCGEGSTTK